jgi:hypothetical protein
VAGSKPGFGVGAKDLLLIGRQSIKATINHTLENFLNCRLKAPLEESVCRGFKGGLSPRNVRHNAEGYSVVGVEKLGWYWFSDQIQ